MGLYLFLKRIPMLPMFLDWQTRMAEFRKVAREDPQRPGEVLSDWAVRIKGKVCDELGLPRDKYVRGWVKHGHHERAYQLLPSTDYIQRYLAQVRQDFGDVDSRVRNAAAILETAQALAADVNRRLTPTDVNDLRARGIIP